MSTEGDIWAAGKDGYLYSYDLLSNKWYKAEGDFDLTNIVRVAVGYDGIPYVVTACGDMFYLSCDNKWVRLPGCGTDVAVGRNGEVFKIGCDERAGGFGIYRLFCKCGLKCCDRGCKRYRHKYNYVSDYKGDDRKCYWFRIDGSGVRLDVSPYGYPFIVNNTGNILGYDGTDWHDLHIGVQAHDIAISNEGAIFFTDKSNNIYRLLNKNDGTVLPMAGSGSAIAAGPLSQPIVIDEYNYVNTSSKMLHN